MGRRWIVATLVLIALFATLAVVVLGRTEAPLPSVVWYCATTREVRETPSGETRSDLFASLLVFRSVTAGPPPPAMIWLYRAPTFAQRVTAWLTPTSAQWTTESDDRPLLGATGTFETADGRSWERFEFGLPLAPSPR